MIAAGMVKVVANDVVHVVAVRDRIVPTRRPVPVRPGVRRTSMIGRADRGVRRGHRQAVLVDVTSVGVVHVTVVQVIAVVIVLDGPVTAALAVNVRMVRVHGVVHTRSLTRSKVGSSVLGS